MKQGFVPSGKSRLRVMREGHAVVREWSIPKPMVLVDSREQKPLRLFQRHPNWIGGEQRVALKSCDYSVEGMTELLALERKSLPDIINCTNSDRPRFIRSCERLAKYHWKANLVEASYEDLKTSYEDLTDVETQVHPNAVCGTLDAIEVKFGIPILDVFVISRFT